MEVRFRKYDPEQDFLRICDFLSETYRAFGRTWISMSKALMASMCPAASCGTTRATGWVSLSPYAGMPVSGAEGLAGRS